MRFVREFSLRNGERSDSVRVVVPTVALDLERDCGFIRIESLDGLHFAQMHMAGSPVGDWILETRLGGHYRDEDDRWVCHQYDGGYRVIVDADFNFAAPAVSHAFRGSDRAIRHHSVAIATAGAGQLLNNAGTGGISWSHNTGSGSNRLLTISGGYGSNNSAAPTHTTTYNSGSTTNAAIATFNSGSGTYRPVAFVDYVTAPASGSLTAAITFGQTNNAGFVDSIDWTGVNQSTPFAASPIQATGNSAGGSQTISNGALTTPTNGALLDGFFIGRTGTLTASHTLDWANDGTGDLNNWGGGQHTFSSGSQTLGWTVDSGAVWQYAHVVAGIQESSASSYTLDAQPASYSYAATNATLLANRFINAQAASYTLSAADATLIANRVINAQAAGYTLSVSDATLIYTPAGAYSVDAQPASFSLSAQDAQLLAARVIDALPASFSVSAASATLIKGFSIDAQPASFTLSAADTAFVRTYVIDAQPASYAVSAFSATLISSAAPSPEPEPTGAGGPRKKGFRFERYIPPPTPQDLEEKIEESLEGKPKIKKKVVKVIARILADEQEETDTAIQRFSAAMEAIREPIRNDYLDTVNALIAFVVERNARAIGPQIGGDMDDLDDQTIAAVVLSIL